MIREAVAAGVAFYLLVMLVQVVVFPAAMVQGIALACALLAGLGLYLYRRKDELERLEIAVLWVCVLLFLAYALMSLGGAL